MTTGTATGIEPLRERAAALLDLTRLPVMTKAEMMENFDDVVTDRRITRHAPDHGHLRATVEGRADDVFHYGDVRVHPHVIRSVMVRAAAVPEYHVRQTERGVEVDAVVASELDQSELERELEEAIVGAGLAQPRVSVRPVDAIARHPDTGKARRFIPL
jgi:phenylacetate-coenzyme A ligase PaaK-like adenylate-forming protein